jgi:gluconolactonase
MSPEGRVDVVADKFDGKRLNRLNDVTCKSDGSLWFTDPSMRIPPADRDVQDSAVYRVGPGGDVLNTNAELTKTASFFGSLLNS